MRSQQGILCLLTDKRVEEGEAVGNVVEFVSSTIRRVTHSTMASESAALSMAVDRQLYTRALFQAIMEGEPDWITDWRSKLTIPGVLVTDA